MEELEFSCKLHSLGVLDQNRSITYEMLYEILRKYSDSPDAAIANQIMAELECYDKDGVVHEIMITSTSDELHKAISMYNCSDFQKMRDEIHHRI